MTAKKLIDVRFDFIELQDEIKMFQLRKRDVQPIQKYMKPREFDDYKGLVKDIKIAMDDFKASWNDLNELFREERGEYRVKYQKFIDFYSESESDEDEKQEMLANDSVEEFSNSD